MSTGHRTQPATPGPSSPNRGRARGVPFGPGGSVVSSNCTGAEVECQQWLDSGVSAGVRARTRTTRAQSVTESHPHWVLGCASVPLAQVRALMCPVRRCCLDLTSRPSTKGSGSARWTVPPTRSPSMTRWCSASVTPRTHPPRTGRQGAVQQRDHARRPRRFLTELAWYHRSVELSLPTHFQRYAGSIVSSGSTSTTPLAGVTL